MRAVRSDLLLMASSKPPQGVVSCADPEVAKSNRHDHPAPSAIHNMQCQSAAGTTAG